jgi:hypothetical protein
MYVVLKGEKNMLTYQLRVCRLHFLFCLYDCVTALKYS